jgi:4-diphosphocytidyl-2-C-methyl-D-erythritol kinase
MTTHFHYSSSGCIEPEQIVPTDNGDLHIWAPAKLNLNLLVGPVGADGYHPLDSVVAKVSFYDELTLSPLDSGNVTLECRGLPCGLDEENLAFRAAMLMQDVADAGGQGVAISLTKRIPPGMGLGGGSSDAAAVLMGLNRLWALDLEVPELIDLGAQLGSDVPLFLGGSCSRMTGRGEILEPVTVSSFAALLVMPPVHCSTGAVYGAFDAFPSPIGQQLDQFEWAGPVKTWRDKLVNDLAVPAFRVREELAEYQRRIAEVTGQNVHVTGSGAGMFICCDDIEEAESLQNTLPEDLNEIAIVAELNPW